MWPPRQLHRPKCAQRFASSAARSARGAQRQAKFGNYFWQMYILCTDNSQSWPNPPLESSADQIFRHRPSISARSRLDHLDSISELPALRPPPLLPPSPSANARPALPRPSDAPPPSPEPPRHACAPRRRPERPSGPLRPASAPSAAATRVHRSREARTTGTPHDLTTPTRVATAVRSRVAPPPHPRFDPLRLTAPHSLL